MACMLCATRHTDAAAATSADFASLTMCERYQITRALVGQLACVLVQRAACVCGLGTIVSPKWREHILLPSTALGNAWGTVECFTAQCDVVLRAAVQCMSLFTAAKQRRKPMRRAGCHHVRIVLVGFKATLLPVGILHGCDTACVIFHVCVCVCVAGCVAFCTATGLQIRNYAGELRFIGSELDETQDSTPLDTALRDLAPADLPMDPAIWHLGPVLQGGGQRGHCHAVP